MTIDRASVERLAQYISPDVRAVMLAQADRIDALECLLGGAETVLEAWDRGNETDFRKAIEEMRADVEGLKAMSEVSSIGPADDGVQRFYRLYARRSSDFAIIETDYCCRTLGGAVAEHRARQQAERLMRAKPAYDQVRITLHVVHPIMQRGFEDE